MDKIISLPSLVVNTCHCRWMGILFNYVITAVEIYLYKSLQINNFKTKLSGIIYSSDVDA